MSERPVTARNAEGQIPAKDVGQNMRGLVNSFKRNVSSAFHVSIKTLDRKAALQTVEEATLLALEALDQLAEIHPVIKAAVIAFTAVIKLDMKRRENNEKLKVLRVEMLSMMAVFQQIENHPEPSALANDAILKALIQEIKSAIEIASSFGDVYAKKNVIIRCVKSSIYEDNITSHAQTFYNLGHRLNVHLSIRGTYGIYTLLRHAETTSSQMNEIKQQLKDLFTVVTTSREKELTKIIQSSDPTGSGSYDDVTLERFIKASGEELEGETQKQKFIQSLKDELVEDLNEALERNLVIFQRKLTLQQKEIESGMKKIYTAVTALSGGHEQINDEGWKIRIKARNFVFALRDFYHNGLHQRTDTRQRTLSHDVDPSSGSRSPSPATAQPSDNDFETTPISTPDDTWALDYLDVSFLQPISEAIDDDGSSFITTKEINEFIDMKPQGCSTPRWLAFWAAGWHSSVSDYADAIYCLLKKFHLLREKVRYENLDIYDAYLHDEPFDYLHQLLKSTGRATAYIHPELAAFRDEFTARESEKLVDNLVTVSFNLDSPATVELVTGPYRIERYIYPLIFILLQRHLQIIQSARLYTVNIAEFQYMSASLRSIFQVFSRRMIDLSVVFQQMNVSPDFHFRRYGFGMDRRESDATTLNAWARLRYQWDQDDDIEVLQVPPEISEDTLVYKPEGPLEFDQSSIITDRDNPDLNSDSLYGSWSAILYNRDATPIYGLFSIVLNPPSSQPDPEYGLGSGSSRLGSHGVRYSEFPRDPEEDGPNVVVSISLFGGWAHCHGTFYASASVIYGVWLSESKETILDLDNLDDHVRGDFVFCRTPPCLLRFRYTPAALKENPAKARWSFAIQSTLFLNRRKAFQKDYVAEALTERRRFVELTIKNLTMKRRVCTPCDLKHHTLPPPHKIARMSTSQFENAHGAHAMVWIRNDEEVNMPEKDQLTRLENHVGRVMELIEQRLEPEGDPDIALRLARLEETLDSVEKRVFKKVSKVRTRLDSIDETLSTGLTRLDTIDERLSAGLTRLDAIDERLSVVQANEKRFDSLENLLRMALTLLTSNPSSE
ncbi:hypothetical protein H0H93_016109 [Arthromyces matolae]|nr:hypothetical protein H0H93_016109 [Arthromyces matolae]